MVVDEWRFWMDAKGSVVCDAFAKRFVRILCCMASVKPMPYDSTDRCGVDGTE